MLRAKKTGFELATRWVSGIVILAWVGAAGMLSGCQDNGFQPELFPVRSGERWGFINARGEVLIAPDYNSADYFVGNRALVENEAGHYGYINASGEMVIGPDYAWALPFSEGLACVVPQQGAPQYIDAEGEVQFKLQEASLAGSFHQGRARVKIDGKWGYIDPQGKMVIAPEYAGALDFHQGLAPVRVAAASEEEGSLYGYINRAGKLVIQPQFQRAGVFSAGLAKASPEGREFGYIDQQGDWVIAPQYQRATDFAGKLAGAGRRGKLALINRQGEALTPARYRSLLPQASGDFIPMQTEEGWGYLTAKGQVRIAPAFDYVSPFVGERALASKSGEYGLIGKDGKFRVQPQFGSVGFNIQDYERFGPGYTFATVESQYFDPAEALQKWLAGSGLMGLSPHPGLRRIQQHFGIEEKAPVNGQISLSSRSVGGSQWRQRLTSSGLDPRELLFRFPDGAARGNAVPAKTAAGSTRKPYMFRCRALLKGSGRAQGPAIAEELGGALQRKYQMQPFEMAQLPPWLQRLLTDGGDFQAWRHPDKPLLAIMGWDTNELEFSFFWDARQAAAPEIRAALPRSLQPESKKETPVTDS